MNKNTIVILVHSLQPGGMERVASELANSFIHKKNLKIHMVLYGKKREIFYPVSEKINIHKPYFSFNESQRFLSTLKTVFFLRNKIKELNPDTILSFGEYWNNLALLATYGLKYPIYIADRSTPLKNLGKIQNSLRKYLYPKATRLILQTEKARQIYRQEFKNLKISIIGNPIREIKDRNDIRRENIILTVGRLIETKHYDRLIKIFARTNHDDWRLIIIGDDAKKQKNKEKLEKLIRTMKIEDKVVFAGQQKDVDSYYLKSKIFAFTSSSEGFPNVVGEAMSAGLPVISYDCMAGPSDMIHGGENGYLVPLFDDKLFKEKLELLMANKDLRNRMGEKASESIKRFDAKRISEKFLEVILNKKRN